MMMIRSLLIIQACCCCWLFSATSAFQAPSTFSQATLSKSPQTKLQPVPEQSIVLNSFNNNNNNNQDDLYDVDYEYVEFNSSTRHLWIVIWATAWWYLYGSFDVIAHPARHYFFKLNEGTLQSLGAAIAFVPLPLYGACTRLGSSRSLIEAQWAVVGIAVSAVPASIFISLMNPLHSRGWTALGFLETTLFLGAYIAHHLRQAAYREPPQNRYPPESPLEALDEYRPSPYFQSTEIATQLAQMMISFHVAVSIIGESLTLSKGALTDLIPFNAQLWPWIIVMLHMGHECMLTATFPGIKLQDRFQAYRWREVLLYSVHIYAALSTPVLQQWLSATVKTGSTTQNIRADQILVVWFIANAATQVFNQGGRIFQAVDWDYAFGLSSQSRRPEDYGEYDYDDPRRQNFRRNDNNQRPFNDNNNQRPFNDNNSNNYDNRNGRSSAMVRRSKTPVRYYGNDDQRNF